MKFKAKEFLEKNNVLFKQTRVFRTLKELNEVMKFKVYPNGSIKEISATDINMTKKSLIKVFGTYVCGVNFNNDTEFVLFKRYSDADAPIFETAENAYKYARLLIEDRKRITDDLIRNLKNSEEKQKELIQNIKNFAERYPDEVL